MSDSKVSEVRCLELLAPKLIEVVRLLMLGRAPTCKHSRQGQTKTKLRLTAVHAETRGGGAAVLVGEVVNSSTALAAFTAWRSPCEHRKHSLLPIWRHFSDGTTVCPWP